MIKNAVIAFELLIIIFCIFVIVFVENQRYAFKLGMCTKSAISASCNDNVHTRTHWLWHLYYASNDSISWLKRYKIFPEEGDWEAFIYPQKNNLKNWQLLGKFSNLASCREASKARLVEMGNAEIADYECALNCKIDEYGRLCEATQQ